MLKFEFTSSIFYYITSLYVRSILKLLLNFGIRSEKNRTIWKCKCTQAHTCTHIKILPNHFCGSSTWCFLHSGQYKIRQENSIEHERHFHLPLSLPATGGDRREKWLPWNKVITIALRALKQDIIWRRTAQKT